MARLSAKTPVGPNQSLTPSGADESSALPGLAAPALLSCLLVLAWPTETHAERVCSNSWQAEFVYVAGMVELDTSRGSTAAYQGQIICDGDIVRAGRYGRASARVVGGTYLQIAPGSIVHIRAAENGTESWHDIVVKTLKGVIHMISRDPRSLSIDTPFVNAGIEGTEFVVQVDPDAANVSVLEGAVALRNPSGGASVTGGTSGLAPRGAKPEAAPDPNVLGTIDWMRRFAPILAGPLPAPDAVPTEAEARSADFHVRRAASRLAVGAFHDADADLATALALDATSGDALAHRALIVLSDGDRRTALDLAARAADAAPDAPAPWLALSHAAEAASDRRRALESAEAAVRAAPDFGYAWARLAEMRFAARDYHGARDAAERAIGLDPMLGYGHAILGFTELAGGSTADAEAAFRAAVDVRDGDALAHLGLGLALYRRGNEALARDEFEVAVVLDPTRSVNRSYAAKFYGEAGRDDLGATQFDLAKALDAEDSTGFYYDAVRKQHENRPGEALLDFRRSFEENDKRRVYGARLSLDEDLRARSAGIGRLHSVLGFDRLGLEAAWRASFDDPTDYSAHRLVADLYASRSRHQTARVNELYQALMHQPLNVTPVQAQLAEASPYVLDVAGPSTLQFQGYQPLFRENGMSSQLSAVTGNNGTRGLDFTVSGLRDRVSYNVSFMDFATDGFRANNDFDERLVSILTQVRPTAPMTITTELRTSDIEKGDLALRFDPDAYFPERRESESVDSLLIGVTRRTANGAWLGTAIGQSVHAQFSGVGLYAQAGSRTGAAFDLQYVTDIGAWNLTWGARHLDQEQLDELSGPAPPIGMPSSFDAGEVIGVRHDVTHDSVYFYGNVDVSDTVRATLGGEVEEVESYRRSVRRHFAPKLGFSWDATARAHVRAAVIGNLQPPHVSKHNALSTLEPTHVAGFNQHYVGAEGEEASRYGVAVDYELAENLFAGIELSRRDVEMPFYTIDPTTFVTTQRTAERDERSHAAYLYWLPAPSLSFAVSYEYDAFDAGEAKLPEGFTSLETHRLPIEINYFHRSGFSVGVETRYVDQSGFFSPVADDALLPEYGEDQFWSVDLSLSYRLPSKRGHISARALNLTDREYRFQDIDPENPRLFPDRIVQIAFTLSY